MKGKARGAEDSEEAEEAGPEDQGAKEKGPEGPFIHPFNPFVPLSL